MKIRTSSLAVVVVILAALFPAIVFAQERPAFIPVYPDEKVMVFDEYSIQGHALYTEGGGRVSLTITEFKPGEYRVTGTLSLQNGSVTCPIKGTYYYDRRTGKGKNELRATAHHPVLGYDLLVDGNMVRDQMIGRALHITIKDPKNDKYYFNQPLSMVSSSPNEKAPSTDRKPTTEEAENAAPVVDGQTPSPPEVKEEWNGRWKIRAKSSTAIEGNQPVVKDWEFEVQTIRDGRRIRLIGDREMMFNLSASNPNVATFKEERKDTIPSGWGDVIDKRVVFLRDGRFYLTIRQDITSHTTLPGLSAGVGHAVNSTIGIGDRMK